MERNSARISHVHHASVVNHTELIDKPVSIKRAEKPLANNAKVNFDLIS